MGYAQWRKQGSHGQTYQWLTIALMSLDSVYGPECIRAQWHRLHTSAVRSMNRPTHLNPSQSSGLVYLSNAILAVSQL